MRIVCQPGQRPQLCRPHPGLVVNGGLLGCACLAHSLELALQRYKVLLPRWNLRASVSRAAFGRGIRRIMRPVRFVENLTRPGGRVTKVGDHFVTLEIADGLEVKVQKQALGSVMPKGTMKTL